LLSQSSHGRRKPSVCPEKVFQAQMIQPGLRFFASVATRRGQALINRSCGLPFRIFLLQPRGIKSGLVVPEEFTLSVWARFVLQDFVKRLERAGAFVFLF